MASGFLVRVFQLVCKKVNLRGTKSISFMNSICPLLLCVTRYLSSSHVNLVVSLKYPLLWMKVDVKWFYSTESSELHKSFTIKDNGQIMHLHIVLLLLYWLLIIILHPAFLD